MTSQRSVYPIQKSVPCGGILSIMTTSVIFLASGPGCTGLEGTIAITVVTAPDSDLRERVVRARLTSSDPQASAEVTRGADGSLALDLDLVATGTTGTVMFEGFDETGDLIAFGRTPPLPIQAVDAEVAIYVGPPMSLAEAPVSMPAARSGMGVARLPSGAALVGGRDAAGTPSTGFVAYSAYSHDLQVLLDLPEARADITASVNASGSVFLFGGLGVDGQTSSTLWRFDIDNFSPSGRYNELSTDATWARSGARAAPISDQDLLITGDPVLVVNSLTNELRDDPDAPALAGTANTIIFDGAYHTVFIGAGNGDGGGLVLRDGDFQTLDEPALRRTGHGTVVLPDATALIVGGQTGGFFDTAGFTVDPRSLEITRHPGLLTVARTDAAIAATDEYVLVAGGKDSDGQVVADAEIVSAATLAPVTAVPMLVPRYRAHAVALESGQVAIFGGLDSADQPIATIELFTPEP